MEEKDKESPLYDWEKGEFVIGMAGQVTTAVGQDAVPIILEKAQRTPRGRYAIYADLENSDLNHKYGSDVFDVIANKDLDEDTKISEVERTTAEAIQYDPWIAEVYDVTATKTAIDLYDADYTVRTTFNNILEMEGVMNE